MGPDRIQEWLCWRGPAAIYLTGLDEVFVRMFRKQDLTESEVRYFKTVYTLNSPSTMQQIVPFFFHFHFRQNMFRP
jgi:hypothetical protein